MYYSLSIMLLVITSIFAMFAQFKVKNTFSTYRNVNIKNQITGAMAAKMVLEANGISDVKIIKDKNIIKYFYPRVGGIMCLTTKSKKFLTPIIQGYKKNIEVCDKKKKKGEINIR